MKKRFAMIGTLGFATALVAASLCGNVYAQNNGHSEVTPLDTTAFGAQNRGAVVCTAAVNSDGTIVGGANVLKTFNAKTGLTSFPGAYDVRFTGPCGGNIKVSNGFARNVQVDTLQIGTSPAGFCSTADRVGVLNGIFVQCYTPTGVGIDASFLLSVTR